MNLLPENLGVLSPRANIEIKNWKPMADREVLFAKGPGEYRKKRKGKVRSWGAS